jgi:hypothetical protein
MSDSLNTRWVTHLKTTNLQSIINEISRTPRYRRTENLKPITLDCYMPHFIPRRVQSAWNVRRITTRVCDKQCGSSSNEVFFPILAEVRTYGHILVRIKNMISPVRVPLFHADTRTDMMRLRVVFNRFTNAREKKSLVLSPARCAMFQTDETARKMYIKQRGIPALKVLFHPVDWYSSSSFVAVPPF